MRDLTRTPGSKDTGQGAPVAPKRKRSREVTEEALYTAAARNHLDFVLDHSTEVRIFLRERHHLGGEEGRFYLEMTERYQALFTRLILDAMSDGVIPSGNPTVTCQLLLGCGNSIVEWFHPTGPLSREDVMQHYLDVIVLRDKVPHPATSPRRRSAGGSRKPGAK